MTEEKDNLPTLDEIFADPLLADVKPAEELKNVKPHEQRTDIDYSANLIPCKDYSKFAHVFDALRADIKAGKRKTRKIKRGQVLTPLEGDFFIRKGQLIYIAEKTELTRSQGGYNNRLRLIYENGMESNPLRTSFRDMFVGDKTARYIPQRNNIGPLSQSFEDGDPDFSGTIYVLRTLSDDPNIKPFKDKIIKIGVTSQEVHRRIADARHDPTFLNAPVKIVATYTLKNLSRNKVETLLHRFFESAKVDLSVPDRLGRHIKPQEWFYVEPECVSQVAHFIKEYGAEMSKFFTFDAQNQRIVRKDGVSESKIYKSL